ncbi:MAG: DNA-protecting protein DprA [Planctomycetes bacterium]|nr:DNA-protecting protein DprA [Planctomycetota bacterium]
MRESGVASEICKKYLRLQLCNGIGAVRFGSLLRELGGIDRVLGATVAEMTRVRGIGDNLAARVARERHQIDIDREVELARSRGVHIVCDADPDFPAPLRMMDDPPPCLYVHGKLEANDAVALAIVGSRHCSRYGAEQAERFGGLFGGAGFTVVSGMARGIDTAAHRGAMAAGGRTIAVLGCGLCHLYPPESGELFEQIAESGAAISELPMEIAPDAKNFPPRNRIIAGLSLGVLVVEAARRSGALITARLANEYNREVFALPGRIDMPSAEGCNELIKSGAAKLVTKLEDVLQELGAVGEILSKPAFVPSTTPLREGPSIDDVSTENQPSLPFESKPSSPRPALNLTAQETRTLELLESDAMPIEALCEISDLPPAQIASALTGLQLKGLVRRVKGDLFERATVAKPR